ncbi:FAD:protein FMN transferase [Halalkalibaculum sp. DA3122]
MLLLFLFLPHLLPAQQMKAERYEYRSSHMGTTFRIVLYADSKVQADSASRAAFRHIEKLDSLLSDYDSESELNRLNRTSGRDTAVVVSRHLFRVLQYARQVSEKTGGAFDVTVGPYVQLWRKMNRQAEPALPTDQTLASMSKRVGFRYVKLDEQHQTVELRQKNMQLDLGGIAKGYAVDQALKMLNRHGVDAALVDGGGDIAIGAPPPGRNGWNIEVLTHDTAGVDNRIMLQLANSAVATSGDLYQYVEIDGTRYSHIIDPRTGLGLTDRRQVTVIASNGLTADSYASAASVLPPEKALRLAEKMKGVALFMEQYRDSGIKRWQSGGFRTLIHKE